MLSALRFAAPEQAWVSELSEFVRIPSISSDVTRRDDVAAAAEWVARFAGRMTDDVEVVDTKDQPLVLARIAASTRAPRAPRVLLYGHFDVQPAGDEADWQSPPFEPDVRDDWLYGRGVTDDKGNLYMLLKAAEQLARAGTLPVDVFVACDGEERNAVATRSFAISPRTPLRSMRRSSSTDRCLRTTSPCSSSARAASSICTSPYERVTARCTRERTEVPP
jgi:acetylornithine deacetylase/succinyl-diaminopimelate desuccinylase-like protein